MHAPRFRIKTLAKQQDTCELQGMKFDLFVEVDLQTFRNAVKTARDHRADCIEIAVYTPAHPSPDPALSTHFFVISYERRRGAVRIRLSIDNRIVGGRRGNAAGYQGDRGKLQGV